MVILNQGNIAKWLFHISYFHIHYKVMLCIVVHKLCQFTLKCKNKWVFFSKYFVASLGFSPFKIFKTFNFNFKNVFRV